MLFEARVNTSHGPPRFGRDRSAMLLFYEIRWYRHWPLANKPETREPDGRGRETTEVKIFGRRNILEKPRFPPNYQGFSWPAQENVFRRN